MAPRGCQNAAWRLQVTPPGSKISLGASKIDPLSHYFFKKSISSKSLTHFYSFFVNFGVLLGGIFGEKID